MNPLNKDNKSIRVKVFYTLRGSKSTRLTTFSIPEENTDLSQISIPLKSCLWSICSSSPDMICRDHDLSIYTANFHESGQGPSEKRDSLIWEGHGLLTWIMDGEDVFIHGKSIDTSIIDIYMELQPTMKWVKEDYFSALRNKSFEQFRISTQTPHHPICNCYHTDESEFDRYQRQSSPPLPTRVPVFRPEPIFPQNKRQNSPPFYNQQDNNLTLPYPKKDVRRSAFTIASLAEKDRYLPPSTSTSCSSSSSSPNANYMKLEDAIPVIYTPSNKKRKKNPAIMPASSSSSSANANNNNHNNNINNNNNNISSSSSSNNTAIPAPLPTPTSDPSSRIYQKTPVQPPPAPPQQQQQQQQQQVNTVVRTYYEVDRDNTGAYILPVEIDSWTVVDLGTVIYERPAYHNQRYIYPANYTVRKWYRSMVDPKSDTQYTCRILENGREPKFEVTADDCPMTYSGPTPTTVWTIIVRRAFAIRNQEYGHNPVGPDFFGLRKNTIAKMIQDLPNASKCSQYVWQTFEPARFNKPGRNRRRADSTLPGSLLGGVNYGLTSSRLIHNTNLSSTQHAYRANSTPSSPTNDHCTTIVETA